MKIISKNRLLDFVASLLPKNPIIVEAGSYNGRDTLKLARYWPQAIVHAFEPVPEIFTILQKTVAQDANVRCYPYALSSTVGQALFYLSQKVGSSDKPFQAGSLHKPTGRLEWSTVKYPSMTQVSTITLDAWAHAAHMNHVDFLWLDVQGHALEIMQASPTIMKTIKILYLEIEFKQAYENQPTFDEVIAWLTAHQFIEIARDFENKDRWFYGNMLFQKQ